MKFSFSILLTLSTLFVYAQKDTTIIYTEVIKLDSVSKEELYDRAKRFFVENYKSANDVIQLDDKENGEIVGKGVFKVNFNQGIAGIQPTSVYHTILIAVKDGRYKYEIKNLIVRYYSKGSSIGTSYIAGRDVENPAEIYASSKMKMFKRFAAEIDSQVNATIALLKEAMTKKQEIKKDDW